MTISGFDDLITSRFKKKKKKKGVSPIFLDDRNPFRARERTDVLQGDEDGTGEREEPSVITAMPDADLLCGPVKHLYQPIRGELTACPIAVRVANRKLADPRTALYTNANAK